MHFKFGIKVDGLLRNFSVLSFTNCLFMFLSLRYAQNGVTFSKPTIIYFPT